MKEWDIYRNREYVGTVFAESETSARHAALYKWGSNWLTEDNISVFRR